MSKPTTKSSRICLSCDKPFPSDGPGNRLCPRCKGNSDYALRKAKSYHSRPPLPA